MKKCCSQYKPVYLFHCIADDTLPPQKSGFTVTLCDGRHAEEIPIKVELTHFTCEYDQEKIELEKEAIISKLLNIAFPIAAAQLLLLILFLHNYR